MRDCGHSDPDSDRDRASRGLTGPVEKPVPARHTFRASLDGIGAGGGYPNTDSPEAQPSSVLDLSLEPVVRFVRPVRSATSSLGEGDVLELLTEGRSSKWIGERLILTQRVLENQPPRSS